MATQKFNNTMKNRLLDLLTSRSTTTVNMSTATATIYSGALPADPDTAPAGTQLASFSLTAGRWGSASSGATQLTNAISFTPTATGTAGFIRLSASSMIMDLDVTATGGGGACILSTLSLTNGTPAQITAMAWKIASTGSGSIKLSTLLRNRLIDMWTGMATPGPDMGTGGAVAVYTGSAPSSADDPATGTLLITFTCTSTTWAVAAGASAALSASVAATAGNSGTIGYCRWYDGSYVIQGSIGTAATDFIMSASSLTASTSYNLTEATVSLP